MCVLKSVTLLIFFVGAFAKSVEETGSASPVRMLRQPPKVDRLPKPDQNRSTASKCGGAYMTNNGGFSHRPFEKVLDNERCTWLIGVPGAVGYTINIQFLGSPTNEPGSGQELVITGVRQNTNTYLAPLMANYLPSTTGTFTVTDVNILVVTFSSMTLNDRPSTGFALRYDGVQIGNITKTSNQSTHHSFQSPTFEFKYPPDNTRYGNLELAAFSFPVVGNIYSGRAKHILYQVNQMEGNFRDGLFVYIFNVDQSPEMGKWEEREKIFHNITCLDIPYDDSVLMLFQSDTTNAYSGFNFSFMGC